MHNTAASPPPSQTEYKLPSNLSAPTGHDPILSFNNHPIRITMIDGVPFYALPDLCDALGYGAYAADCVRRPSFPHHAKRVCEETTEDGPQDTLALSPVGVFLWTNCNNPGRGQAITAWARREAMRLCPNPAPDDPAMFLQLDQDGDLPPRPMKFSGWLSAWLDLRDSSAYLDARLNKALVRRDQMRELFAAADTERLAGETA